MVKTSAGLTGKIKISGRVPTGRLHDNSKPIPWPVRLCLWFKPLRWMGRNDGGDMTTCVGYKEFRGVVYEMRQRVWCTNSEPQYVYYGPITNRDFGEVERLIKDVVRGKLNTQKEGGE